jgi:mitochondrial fission protein ELM1
MPRHDRPPKRKNVVTTEGALNIIGETYLRQQAEDLTFALGLNPQVLTNSIGLLIGGDTKNFTLNKEVVGEVIKQLKNASQVLKREILATTSRRTSREVESLVKDELKDYPSCRILIIAKEKNLPSAVGGILGLSRLVVVSPESISMISEAVTSERYVLVFKSDGIDKRHRRFLDYFASKNYIFLCEPENIARVIEEIGKTAPRINSLKDKSLIKGALEKLV